jgi:hypothetical protein
VRHYHDIKYLAGRGIIARGDDRVDNKQLTLSLENLAAVLQNGDSPFIVPIMQYMTQNVDITTNS